MSTRWCRQRSMKRRDRNVGADAEAGAASFGTQPFVIASQDCSGIIVVNKAGQRNGHLADQMCLAGIIRHNDALVVGANGVDNLIAAARHRFLLFSLIFDMRREDLLCDLQALDACRLQAIESILIHAICKSLVTRWQPEAVLLDQVHREGFAALEESFTAMAGIENRIVAVHLQIVLKAKEY